MEDDPKMDGKAPLRTTSPSSSKPSAQDHMKHETVNRLMYLPAEIRYMILSYALRLPDQLHYWCYCQGAREDQDTNRLVSNVEEFPDSEDSGSDDKSTGGEGRYTIGLPCAHGTDCELHKRRPVMMSCGQCLSAMDKPEALCSLCRQKTMMCWLAIMQTSRQLSQEAAQVFVSRGFTIRIFRSVIRFGNWNGEKALKQMKVLRVCNARFLQIEMHDWHLPETQATFQSVLQACGTRVSKLEICLFVSSKLINCIDPSLVAVGHRFGPDLPSSLESFRIFGGSLATARIHTLLITFEVYEQSFPDLKEEASVEPQTRKRTFGDKLDQALDEDRVAEEILGLLMDEFGACKGKFYQELK